MKTLILALNHPFKKSFWQIVIFSLLISGCKVSYLINYSTHIENGMDRTLQYKDSLISLDFKTVPNGVIFDIKNLTKNNLFLIWDKSYFIDPTGNSSKSLNTDILETQAIIREKETNESIIPQGAHFVRFTCPSKNISSFSQYNSKTLYNEISKTINIYSGYSKFYYSGNYWYIGQKRNYIYKGEISNLDRLEIFYVQRFIKDNNQLGIGFTIRSMGKDFEYHFKLPIYKAEIFKKLPSFMGSNQSYIKSFELNEENEFSPRLSK